MFTKIYNTWSSGYPFLNITKYVVDGVISLNVVSHSWMWWYFFIIPIILIFPLIIALLLDLIMLLIFFNMFILTKPLFGWSGVIWGLTLRLITWILRPYITNSHSLQGITWSFPIINKIKINLLLLRVISLIKHRITCCFNTTRCHVENTICTRVWIIT
jgi:hypothetical protein